MIQINLEVNVFALHTHVCHHFTCREIESITIHELSFA